MQGTVKQGNRRAGLAAWLVALTVGVVLGCRASGGESTAEHNPSAGGKADHGTDGSHRFPLRTSGRWIVDAEGQRYKIAGVNWYGAESEDFVVGGLDEQPLRALATRIRELGFNTVRIPWSNELVERNPRVDPTLVEANPELAGKRALEVLDETIDALAEQGLAIILVNHVSDAIWCCNEDDGNGLWFNERYPEDVWVAHWRLMAYRYAEQPAVVAAELRNELRRTCTSGESGSCEQAHWGGDDRLDWRRAAVRAGNAVLGANSDLLIVVDGLQYAADLTGAHRQPVQLELDRRLVYAAHDYGFFYQAETSEAALHRRLGEQWGFLLQQNKPYTAPVIVTEFGTCTDGRDDCGGPPHWFRSFLRYLKRGDIDWVYWPLNGTMSSGASRRRGARDFYGLLAPDWHTPASPEVMSALEAVQQASQGPGID